MSGLGGFLFGNIDEEGRIDNDDFDEELKANLTLFTERMETKKILGLDSIVEEEASSQEKATGQQHIPTPAKSQPIKPLPDAEDFEEFNELAEDQQKTISPAVSVEAITPMTLPIVPSLEEPVVSLLDVDMDELQVVPFDGRQILKFSRLSAPPALLNATGRSFSRYSVLRKLKLKKRHLSNKHIGPVENQIESFLTKSGTSYSVPSAAAARLRLSLVNLNAVTGGVISNGKRKPWMMSDRYRDLEKEITHIREKFASKEENAPPSINSAVHLPEDSHFHPISTLEWENSIIWSSEDVMSQEKKEKRPGMFVNMATAPPTTMNSSPSGSNISTAPGPSQPPSNSPSLSSILSSLSLSGSGIGGDSATATALLALIRNQQMQRSASASSLASSTSSLRATPPTMTRSPSLANRQPAIPVPSLKFPKSSAARIINQNLERDDWTESIIWDPSVVDASKIQTHLILPLDDPDLIFSAQSVENLSKKLSRAEKLISKRLKKLRTPGSGASGSDALYIASYARPLPDKFNLSNDKYYEPSAANGNVASGTASTAKATEAVKIQSTTVTSLSSISAAFLGLSSAVPALQHAVPALKLSSPAFQTCRTKRELRLWHRPRLSFPSGFTIDSWARVKGPNGKKMSSLTVSEIITSIPATLHVNQSGGVIRSFKKLSLRDASRFLVLEYSEEYPPLMLNPGMGTYVVLYYRKKSPQDTFVPSSTFATVHVLDFTDPSPFWAFGDVPAGGSRYALCNGLFRAPLFPHPAPSSDFICGRRVTVASGAGDEEASSTGPEFFLRPLDVGQVFCVGQEFPVAEVPGPHSRRHNQMCRNRLQVAAYRLFNKDLTGLPSDPTRKRLKIGRLLSAFPQFSEGSIRKWLKDYAESTRAGKDSGVWLLKTDAPHLDEDELRNLMTPEMVCAYESMMAEQQRIADAEVLLFDPLAKDAGKGTSALDEVDDIQSESESISTAPAAKKRVRGASSLSGPIGDVIRTSPWHLTANFLSAVQGRTALQLRGLGDPTGHGEAFSFLKASASNMIMGKPGSSLTPTSNEYRQEVAKIWEAQVASLSANSASRAERVLPNSFGPSVQAGSKLVIQRKVADSVVSETIEDPLVIAAYLRHRLRSSAAAQTDKKMRRGFVAPDAMPVLSGADLMPLSTSSGKKSGQSRSTPKNASSSIATAANKNLQIRCGACGQVGHMRTNRVCPLFGKTPEVALHDSSADNNAASLKLKIKVLPHESGSSNDSTLSSTDSIFPSPVLVPVSHRPAGPPIQPLPSRQRKRPRKLTPKQLHSMFLASLSAENRAQLVALSSHLIALVDSILALPTTLAFHKPVSRKLYPLYYKIIDNPVDLSSIRAKAVALSYLKSSELIDDFTLMSENCDQFNGQGSPLSLVALDMLERAKAQLDNDVIRELDAFLIAHVKHESQNEDQMEGNPEDEMVGEEVSIVTDPEEAHDEPVESAQESNENMDTS